MTPTSLFETEDRSFLFLPVAPQWLGFSCVHYLLLQCERTCCMMDFLTLLIGIKSYSFCRAIWLRPITRGLVPKDPCDPHGCVSQRILNTFRLPPLGHAWKRAGRRRQLSVRSTTLYVRSFLWKFRVSRLNSIVQQRVVTRCVPSSNATVYRKTNFRRTT